MSPARLAASRDPNFPDYAYTADRLVDVYERAGGRTKVARVFMGEWMKVEEVRTSGWAAVKFRGGRGFVRVEQLARERHLEVFFIDVDQGDAILIQTPDDRRILIDGGMTGDAHDFVRNKYRLDKPDNYIDFEAIVASHSDQDHVQGLLKVLKDPKIAVKRVYHNCLFRDRPDRGVRCCQ